MAKTKSKRMGSARKTKRTNEKKAQSAVEYLLTYSWAILLVALVVAILYMFIFSPQSIVPSSCSFSQGAFCHDLVFGSSTSSSQVAMLLTNKQKFPIVNPSLIVNISKVGSIIGTCAPSYVLAGGAMICTLSLPSTTLSLGSLVSGNMYLSAIPCPSADEVSCQSGTAQTYVGNFNTHVSTILSSTNTLVTLTVQNATQAASGIKDKLTANVKLLGYPVQGATVSFTSNSAAATVYPSTITTDDDGNAVSYISDTSSEDVKVTATFAGSTANTVISFVPATYIYVKTTSMSGISSPIYSFDGQQYTTNSMFAVNPGSSHSFSFNSFLSNGAGDTQYSYSSTSGCGATSQTGNLIASLNCTLFGSYQTQYYLTMGENPAEAALSISPSSGFYDAGNTQTLSQTPSSAAYSFSGWQGTGTGSYSGSSSTYDLVIDGPITENAQYNVQPLYTFATSSLSGNTGAIGTYVTIDAVGMPYNGVPFQSYWAVGSQHSYSYLSTISGGTGVEYTYNGMQASDCNQTLQSNMLTVGSVNCQTTASYNTLFQLTIAKSGSGSGTLNPVAGSTWQQNTNTIALTFTPDSGNEIYSIACTGDGCTDTSNNVYSGSLTTSPVTMYINMASGPVTETVDFEPSYAQYIFSKPSSFGTDANSYNTIIIDGANYMVSNMPLTFSWATGSTHSYTYNGVVASTNSGERYAYSSVSSTANCGFSGTASGSITVGTTSPCTSTASYNMQYQLTMAKTGTGTGTISPSSTTWENACSTANCASISLSATPSSNKCFNGWTGSGTGSYTGTSTSATITEMPNPITETADFGKYSLWVSDSTYSPGTIRNICDKGTVLATFTNAGTQPAGIALDSSGNIWVVDMYGYDVKKLTNTGTVLGTFSTSSPQPEELVIDGYGNVWVADTNANIVNKFDSSGTRLGAYAVGSSTTSNPTGIALDSSYNVWVTDGGSGQISKLSNSGTVLGNYNLPDSGDWGYGIAVSGSYVWTVEYLSNKIVKFSTSGSVLGSYSLPSGSNPLWLTVDPSGNVWVTSGSKNTINKFSSSGTLLGTYNTCSGPNHIISDSSGNIWITCTGGVEEFSNSGTAIGTYSLPGTSYALVISG